MRAPELDQEGKTKIRTVPDLRAVALIEPLTLDNILRGREACDSILEQCTFDLGSPMLNPSSKSEMEEDC